MKNIFLFKILILLCLFGSGCVTGSLKSPQKFAAPKQEADWIREGEPIIYDNQTWIPSDMIDGFLDSEVYLIDEYRGVQFFVDRADVKPYQRLYTKFDKNRYRVFTAQ